MFVTRKGKSERAAGIGIRTQAMIANVNNHQTASNINFKRKDGSIKLGGSSEKINDNKLVSMLIEQEKSGLV